MSAQRGGLLPHRRDVLKAALAVAVALALVRLDANEPSSPRDAPLDLADRFTHGTIDGLDDVGRLILREQDAAESLPATQSLRFGRCLDLAPGPFVVCRDGSRLPGTPRQASDDEWAIEGPASRLPWKTIRAPKLAVQAAWILPPRDALERDRVVSSDGPFGDLASPNAELDRLWLKDDSVVAGDIIGKPGGPTDDGTLPFLPGGAKKAASIPIDRIRALALRTNESAVQDEGKGPVGDWIGFADGTLLALSSIAAPAAPGGSWRLSTRGGATLELASPSQNEFLGSVVFVRRIADDSVPVVGLQPIAWRHEPLIGEPGKWLATTDPVGRVAPARVAGELHWEAIRQPSTSLLAWEVPAGAKTFASRIALEDRAGRDGSVRFQLSIDGPTAGAGWKTVYDSGLVKGGEAPREVVVAVAGAKRLRAFVDMADRGDVCDYAVWLAPRFAR